MCRKILRNVITVKLVQHRKLLTGNNGQRSTIHYTTQVSIAKDRQTRATRRGVTPTVLYTKVDARSPRQAGDNTCECRRFSQVRDIVTEGSSLIFGDNRIFVEHAVGLMEGGLLKTAQSVHPFRQNAGMSLTFSTKIKQK